MQTAPRWAANLAKVMGAVAWGMGMFLHLSLFTFVVAVIGIVVHAENSAIPINDWRVMVRLFIAAFSGPGAVLVGGGLRFLGGLMAGTKIAGEQAPRIMLFEWLRYELFAVGIAANIFSFGAFSLMEFSILWAAITFFGLIIFGVGCLFLAARFGKMSTKLMWDLREAGIRRGDVPHPADAIVTKRPFNDLSREAEPGDDSTAFPASKKHPLDSVSGRQDP